MEAAGIKHFDYGPDDWDAFRKELEHWKLTLDTGGKCFELKPQPNVPQRVMTVWRKKS